MRSVARRFGLILANLQRHRPHMGAALDAARALREVESVSDLYKREKQALLRLREMGEKAFEAGQFSAAAQLMEVARKQAEILSKFAQTPGFRDAQPSATINAPEARIIVTRDPVRMEPAPQRALPPADRP